MLPSVTAVGAMKRLGISNEALEKALPQMVTMALHRLYAFEHSDGGWGWWRDDDTKPWMTAYVMYGLLMAKAAGFDVDPHVLKRGLESLRSQEATALGLYVRKLSGEEVALDRFEPANDEDRAWLVLAGRTELAKEFGVGSRTNKPGDVRQLALMLRAIASVDPKDPRIGPMRDWLLSARRGGAWWSTIDSAYAVYALCDLAANEKEPTVTATVNGVEAKIVAGRALVKSLKAGRVDVSLKVSGGVVFASALLRWVSGEENVPAARGAFEVERIFQRFTGWKDDEKQWEDLPSGATVSPKDDLRVIVRVKAMEAQEYVMVEAPLPAGTEARDEESDGWYDRRELRDDRVSVAVGHLTDQVQAYTFRLKATVPGTYHVMPASAFAMYEPERKGRSSEFVLKVKD